MSKTSREKIALFIFFCLVLVGLGTTVAYLNVGHSWNVAASNIDDAAGDMEGYTAILYEGTAKPPVKEEAKTTKPPSKIKAAADAETGSEAAAETEAEAEVETEGVPILNANAADQEKEKEKPKEPVSLSAVEKSYQDKQATVFVLDVAHPEQYADGMILRKGNHRFGVFSVAFNQSIALTEKQIAYFKSYKVDFIVAITPDKKFVEKAPGIDIVVSLKDEGLFLMGETIDHTFYVDAPLVGTVGAIVISPHSVVSSKDISEI
ncbi:MAG: alcohol dehydrogenase [Raoultibacter sp.]